jgi:hypothetical protein
MFLKTLSGLSYSLRIIHPPNPLLPLPLYIFRHLFYRNVLTHLILKTHFIFQDGYAVAQTVPWARGPFPADPGRPSLGPYHRSSRSPASKPG